MPELTLEKALDVVLCTEATEMQMKELDSDSSCMELEGKRTCQPARKHLQIMKKKDLQARSSIARTVKQDGARECPAYGKTCNYCQRRNHFQIT